ncbi:RIP metalloprotease [Candidatus Curtissbacteria bacterium]|nr:RIP metalloprotease [Candidatus Curtissbacteria bacterium]
MISIVIFILILSILVMLHEFGHFIMAKRAKIGVEEFGFGLPPRIWGKKIKGTLYSINWLPFGGFVRLVGEDSTDTKRNAKNSFQVKSLKERMYVVLAGVTMNLILAVAVFYVVIFALGFKVNLPLVIDHKFSFVEQSKQVLVSDVAAGGIAQQAGIKAGDSIVRANGQNIATIEDLQKIVRSSQGKPVDLQIENSVNNQYHQVSVIPKYNDTIKAPAIGVGLGELVVLNYKTVPQKIFSGFIHSYNTTAYSMAVFGRLIGYAIQNHDITPVSEGVSGPVGIARITQDAVALGPLSVLQLVALLSLNLAVMNVLPIPALDGGRFFFLVWEAVTRRKPKPALEKWVHTVGFVVLIGLIMVITFNDIAKLFR